MRIIENLRSISHEERCSDVFNGKSVLALRNLMIFPKKCNQKTMISVPKTLKILKVQIFSQKASRSLQSWDMSNLKISQNSKNRKFKSDFPLWKMLGEFFDEKGVSAPQKLSDVFKKIVSKNNDFRLKKMKNT